MIDQRFSRDAFESLRAAAERQYLARELAREMRESTKRAASFEDGLSAALARLRLIGHHLYPRANEGPRRVFSGTTASDGPATGLTVEIDGTTIDVRYKR